MSNPEFDNLRRQFSHILRGSAAAFRSSAIAVEQYANIIEAGVIPSAHDIAQISSQLPQVTNPATGKSKKKGKDHDGDHLMFESLLAAGDDGDSKKRKRGQKKERDPNAPKRPPSAYLLYQNHVRSDMKAKNPEVTYPELLALISKQWTDLNEEEKKPFVDATAVAKEQYEEDKAKYDAQLAAAAGGSAEAGASVPAPAAAASPSEESDVADSPVAAAPVVVPTKASKSKAAEKVTNKSPPKDKKKAAPAPPPEPSESVGDEELSDEVLSEEEEPPKKKAKKEKASPPKSAKKEKKTKEEKSPRRK